MIATKLIQPTIDLIRLQMKARRGVVASPVVRRSARASGRTG